MNTQVDFYLIEENHSDGRNRFACRLLEKAYGRQHQVFVLCGEQKLVNTMDELLWTYADTSFIPHNILGEGPTPPPPIQLGCQIPSHHKDILLLLDTQIPETFSQFRRLLIIVPNEDNAKQQAREQYRYFRQQGCTLKSHDLE